MPFPPAYDWNEGTPGVDAPTSPLMAMPILRQMCSFHFAIPILVPRNALQSLLPPDFTAGQSAGDPTASVVNLAFGVHTRFQLNGVAHGPFLNFLVAAPGTSNDALGRLENVVLGSFISDNGARNAFNNVNGPDTSRAPLDYRITIDEDSDTFRIKVIVDLPRQNPGRRCRVRASARFVLTDIAVRQLLQPQPGPPPPVPLRSTAGKTAHGARWTAIQADVAATTPINAKARLRVTRSRLSLPAGRLRILGINQQNTPLAMVAVRNNAEIFSANA